MADIPSDNQSLPPISQQIELLVQASTEKAKPLLAFMQKMKKQVTLNQKGLAKYDKLWKKTEKQLSKTRKSVDKIIISQKKISDKVKVATANVLKQTKALRQQQNQMKQNVQASRSYADGLARLAIVAGGAFFGLKKLQEFVDTRFNQALLTGAESLERIAASAGANISPDSAFELVSKFQQQDLSTLALGLREEIQTGLLDAQAELAKGLGASRANQLLLDLTKATLDSPKKLQALLSGPGSFQERVLGSVDIDNLSQVIQVLNALKLPELEAQDKLPQVLESAQNVSEALESMNKAVSNITTSLIGKLGPAIDKVAGIATEHPTATAVGVAGAAGATAVGVGGIGTLANFLLLRKFLGTGAATAATVAQTAVDTGIPRITGFTPQPPALPPAAEVTAQAGRGIVRSILSKIPHVLATAGFFSIGEGVVNLARGNDLEDATTVGRQFGERLLDPRFEQQQAEADKLQLDAITKIKRQGFLQSGSSPLDFLAEKIESFSEAQEIEISELEETFERLKKSYGIRQAVKFTDILDKLKDKTDELSTPAQEAAKQLEKTKEALKGVGQAAATSLAPIFEEARSLKDLQLGADLQRSVTQIRQIERDLQSVGPFGQLTAIPEQQVLIISRRKEIESLTNILDTLQVTDEKSAIRFNAVVSSIRQLELQNRQDSQRLLDSFQGQGDIFGLGSRFSKIIVSLKNLQNLAPAISGGFGNLHKTLPQLTGQVLQQSKGIQPRPVADVFGPSGHLKLIDAQSIQQAKSAILKITRQAPPLPLNPAAPPRAAFEGEVPQQIIEAQESIIDSTSELRERFEIHESTIERELHSTSRELSEVSESEVLRELQNITDNTERELQQSIERTDIITEVLREISESHSSETATSESTNDVLRELQTITDNTERELQQRISSSHSEVLQDMIRQSMEVQQSVETSQILESLKEMNTITQNELESSEQISNSQTLSEVIRELQDVSQTTETHTLNTTTLLTKIIQETQSVESNSIRETNNDIQEVLASTERHSSQLLTDILRESSISDTSSESNNLLRELHNTTESTAREFQTSELHNLLREIETSTLTQIEQLASTESIVREHELNNIQEILDRTQSSETATNESTTDNVLNELQNTIQRTEFKDIQQILASTERDSSQVLSELLRESSISDTTTESNNALRELHNTTESTAREFQTSELHNLLREIENSVTQKEQLTSSIAREQNSQTATNESHNALKEVLASKEDSSQLITEILRVNESNISDTSAESNNVLKQSLETSQLDNIVREIQNSNESQTSSESINSLNEVLREIKDITQSSELREIRNILASQSDTSETTSTESTQLSSIRNILTSTERELQQTLDTSQLVTNILSDINTSDISETTSSESTQLSSIRDILSSTDFLRERNQSEQSSETASSESTNDVLKELQSTELRGIANIINQSEAQTNNIERDTHTNQRTEVLEVVNNVTPEIIQAEAPAFVIDAPELPSFEIPQLPSVSLPDLETTQIVQGKQPVIETLEEPSTTKSVSLQSKLPPLRNSQGGATGASTKKGAQMIADGLSLIIKNGDVIDFLLQDSDTQRSTPASNRGTAIV